MKAKKTTFLFAALIAIGTIFLGCQSNEKKLENSMEEVQEEQKDLNQAQQEAATEAKTVEVNAEWNAYKIEALEKINKNEIRIAELKAKKAKKGELLDPLYEKRIEKLEQKNAELKAKIATYESQQSDWEAFKREFNHDMDELGNALKDFDKDNAK